MSKYGIQIKGTGRAVFKDGGKSQKKKDRGDILGDRFDKKFKKHALSKEAHLHAKDYDEGIDRAEKRAMKEVAQEAAIPLPKFNKGGRVNTSRENRLEELGRVDAEKARTSKGKRNLKDEKRRIVKELKK